MTSRSGFSLIELICAIFILGIGLAGLSRGVTTALSSSKEAERHTTASLLAAGRMEMLKAEGSLIRGEDEGEFAGDFPAYRWRENVRETATEGLFEVRVLILNSETGRVIYELDTRLFQEPESEMNDVLQGSGQTRRNRR